MILPLTSRKSQAIIYLSQAPAPSTASPLTTFDQLVDRHISLSPLIPVPSDFGEQMKVG